MWAQDAAAIAACRHGGDGEALLPFEDEAAQ